MGRESEWDAPRTSNTEVDALREENTRLKRDREAAEAHWIAKLAKLQARIGAVVAIATESRRKAVAGTGYGLIYSHEVLALLEEETP